MISPFCKDLAKIPCLIELRLEFSSIGTAEFGGFTLIYEFGLATMLYGLEAKRP